MRKFLFSSTMISAVFQGFGALQTTRKGPRDWRLALMWIIWGLTVAIAIGTVKKQADTGNELED